MKVNIPLLLREYCKNKKQNEIRKQLYSAETNPGIAATKQTERRYGNA